LKEFYVYTLTDPRDQSVFYVGKGCGRRMYAHEAGVARGRIDNPFVFQRVLDIHSANMKVDAQVVMRTMYEADAFREESRLIQELGLESLENIQPGRTRKVDKVKAWAAAWLQTIWAFDEWVAIQPRSPEACDRYHHLVASVQQMAWSPNDWVRASCVTDVVPGWDGESPLPDWALEGVRLKNNQSSIKP